MRWGFAAGEILLADDPRPLLEQAARTFDHWEVTGEGPLGRRDGIASIADTVDALDLDLTYHAAFAEVDLAASDPHLRQEHVARVGDQIRWAADLGATAVVVHPGDDTGPGAARRARRSLAGLGDRAAEAGVDLLVENMPGGTGQLGQRPDALAGLARGTVDGVCLDLGHLRTVGLEADLDGIDGLVDELHVHANDGTGDRHRPVGPDAGWLVPWLERYLDCGIVAVFEHRHVDDCVASRRAVEALLDGPTG